MDENIKNLREAQQQQKGSQKREPSSPEENEVDVEVSVREAVDSSEEMAPLVGREDSIVDPMGESIADPLSAEQMADPIMEMRVEADTADEIAAPKKNKTPMKKLINLSKKLTFRFAKDAFEEDDPAAYTALMREMRGRVTHDFSEADLELMYRFREELRKLWKRAKKSVSDTELSPFEITELNKVVDKLIDVQEIMTESDLPFVLDDVSDVEEGEGNLSRIEDMEEDIISPSDQEQLLDDDIYLVEIEEEEADDFTRWSEPILKLIAVRDPKKVEEL